MSSIPAAVRRLVRERARERCEYCWFPQIFAGLPHEPDHILPHQHGGDDSANNLALACFDCNRHKGPNVGSFDPETGVLTRFFNPRIDNWATHFEWEGALVKALTGEGRVTLKIFAFNTEVRVAERVTLIELGLYFET